MIDYSRDAETISKLLPRIAKFKWSCVSDLTSGAIGRMGIYETFFDYDDPKMRQHVHVDNMRRLHRMNTYPLHWWYMQSTFMDLMRRCGVNGRTEDELYANMVDKIDLIVDQARACYNYEFAHLLSGIPPFYFRENLATIITESPNLGDAELALIRFRYTDGKTGISRTPETQARIAMLTREWRFPKSVNFWSVLYPKLSRIQTIYPPQEDWWCLPEIITPHTPSKMISGNLADWFQSVGF